MNEPQQFSRRLLKWYERHRRDLPWRVAPGSKPGVNPDPYYVLVSEAMLQQTQVVTVIPYFHRFIARLPTLASLAASEEQDVLRLWQGLGYYSRARNLRAAAVKAVADFAGKLPATVAELLTLPGVGRYTAGAIASLAFGTRAPIVDGNVVRVICRLDHLKADPRSKDMQQTLWRRAEEILPGGSLADRVGDFNSALMELGATVCTPRNPQCLICPVRANCQAADAGTQESIPPPKATKKTPLERRATFCIARKSGEATEYLFEQRPPTGRWAGMWQFPSRAVGADSIATLLKTITLARTGKPSKIGEVRHALTHRRYEFDVYRCDVIGKTGVDAANRKWLALSSLNELPLPKPHLKIAGMLVHSGE